MSITGPDLPIDCIICHRRELLSTNHWDNESSEVFVGSGGVTINTERLAHQSISIGLRLAAERIVCIKFGNAGDVLLAFFCDEWMCF